MWFYLILLVIFPIITTADESCERPKVITDFEEQCKTDPEVTGNTGTFLETIQENIAAAVEQTKRIFNVARKKLGIKYNEETEDDKTKKCEYYQCIFRKMNSLGFHNYPNMTLMDNWVSQNVETAKRDSTLNKIDSCFNALAMNIDYGSDMSPEDMSSAKSACEVSTKLMMCLSTDRVCSVFKYP